MGEAKRRGTFEERVRQSKLREGARHEAEERRWAEHRQQMLAKTFPDRRKTGMGLMAAAVALAGAGLGGGMVDRAVDATRRAE